jgi:hypothetical protein
MADKQYTLEDLSPCLSCITKECGLVDGNECEKYKCFSEAQSRLSATKNIESRVLVLFEVFKSNTYKCEVCGAVIFPQIITAGDDQFDVMVNAVEVRGGYGNEVIHRRVCNECVENMTIKRTEVPNG